ncbi:glycosyltransferase [Undibacterium sp. 5I1]|nr:glycosyltransferase [Undibacterium sp. 5I1]
MRSLLENVYDEIHWIDPTITRLPRWSDVARSTQAEEKHAAEPLLPQLHVLRPGGLPIEPIPLFNRVNDWFVWHKIKANIASLDIDLSWDIGIGRPSRLALWAVENLQSRISFMDVMDDFPAFYSGLSRYSMERTEDTLAGRCDYLFCSEETLIRKLAKYSPRVSIKLVSNGYDMQRLPAFSTARSQKEVIGFIGTIATWFDWRLVIEMANALPQLRVKLIGPRAGYIPSHLPSNIELLPACTVEDAIRHCQNFTVGLIPFLNNQLTRSVDPIKYYELRALGIPVWSTAFGSMVNRLNEPGVAQIYSGIDWKKLWEESSNVSADPIEIARFRQNNDWTVRFEKMPEYLNVSRKIIKT